MVDTAVAALEQTCIGGADHSGGEGGYRNPLFSSSVCYVVIVDSSLIIMRSLVRLNVDTREYIADVSLAVDISIETEHDPPQGRKYLLVPGLLSSARLTKQVKLYYSLHRIYNYLSDVLHN